MPTASDNVRLECETIKTAAGGALFQFQQGQRAIIRYSKKLPKALHNSGITEFELTGLFY